MSSSQAIATWPVLYGAGSYEFVGGELGRLSGSRLRRVNSPAVGSVNVYDLTYHGVSLYGGTGDLGQLLVHGTGWAQPDLFTFDGVTIAPIGYVVSALKSVLSLTAHDSALYGYGSNSGQLLRITSFTYTPPNLFTLSGSTISTIATQVGVVDSILSLVEHSDGYMYGVGANTGALLRYDP